MTTKVSNTVGPMSLRNMFNQDPMTTTGLTFGYTAGSALDDTYALVDIPAGTVNLAATSTNVVFIDYENPAPIIRFDTISNLPDRELSVLLYVVRTNNNSITSVEDYRSWSSGVSNAV